MPDSSAANPLPPPDGDAKPSLSVVPPEPKRRSPSALNQAQVAAVNKHKTIALAAQDPALAPALEARTITPDFVATLLTDIESALNRGIQAAVLTDKKEGATLDIEDAARALVNDLRTAQAMARQAFFHSNPTRLNSYFIGHRIDANRVLLDGYAVGIIDRLKEDRPAGASTEFIRELERKRQVVFGEIVKKSAEGSHAMTERALRDEAVESIRERTQQIQFAADAAWPAHVAGNGGTRRRFHIPLNRPFTA